MSAVLTSLRRRRVSVFLAEYVGWLEKPRNHDEQAREPVYTRRWPQAADPGRPRSGSGERAGPRQRLTGGGYERSLIYSGLRGVGKTVLVMEFDVLASEAGWATTDVQEVGSQPDFRVTFARMAARLLREM